MGSSERGAQNIRWWRGNAPRCSHRATPTFRFLSSARYKIMTRSLRELNVAYSVNAVGFHIGDKKDSKFYKVMSTIHHTIADFK